MVRLAIYIFLALLVAVALAWWLDAPGEVTINWRGGQYYTSFAAIVFFTAFLLGVALLLQSLWHWVRRDMPLVGENRHLTRQRKGLTFLNQAIVALAAGDGKRATKLVEKAKKRLPPQPMMHVVAAQAAKLSGDKESARLEFEGLLEDPAAAFLGVRGLLVQAVADGRGSEARRLAEQAKEINPKSAWAIKTLFDLQVKATDWEEARQTLAAGKKAKAFTKEEGQKLLATLYYCQAKEADLGGDRAQGRKLVGRAIKAKKDFFPGVLMAARLDIDDGQTRRAASILEAAFGNTPHPDIARAYSRIAPMETDIARYKRFKKLTKKNPNHPESHMLLAIQALALDKVKEAEGHLDKVIAETGRARALTLKALLEEKRGAPEEEISKLRERAVMGAPEPLWGCTNCGAEVEKWALHCPTCRMFNTLEWQTNPGQTPKGPDEEMKDFLVMLPDPSKTQG
ncbi:MAG: tetratricopeptide repeat protein [Sphingomonadales bacterium]